VSKIELMLKHTKIITGVVIMFLLLGFTLWFFYESDKSVYSFYAHLAAVFIEIALSITILELFFEYARKQETFKVYSLVRSYIFERVFYSLNRLIIQDQTDFVYIDKLGHYPSFDKYLKKNKFLAKLSEDILNKLSDGCILELARVIQKDFDKLERSSNSYVVSMNEDLLTSLLKFVDSSYQLAKIDLTPEKVDFIINSLRHDIKIPDYDLSWRDIYKRVIYSWLYIINNFIYFSNKDSELLRYQFKSLANS
jgi:hypothetical protein